MGKDQVTRRAQTTFQCLKPQAQASYTEAKKGLQDRFEPASRRALYQAEFDTQRKKATEGWAEYADDLNTLVEKAFPEMGEDGREQLALTKFLSQLEQPQVRGETQNRGCRSQCHPGIGELRKTWTTQHGCHHYRTGST